MMGDRAREFVGAASASATARFYMGLMLGLLERGERYAGASNGWRRWMLSQAAQRCSAPAWMRAIDPHRGVADNGDTIASAGAPQAEDALRTAFLPVIGELIAENSRVMGNTNAKLLTRLVLRDLVREWGRYAEEHRLLEGLPREHLGPLLI